MFKSTASTTIPAHTTTPPRWVTLEVCAPVLGYVYSQLFRNEKSTTDRIERMEVVVVADVELTVLRIVCLFSRFQKERIYPSWNLLEGIPV